MSRDIPPPDRARKSRSLSAALDDFTAEKKATRTRFPALVIGLAVVGLAGTVGAGVYVIAHAGGPPAAGDEGKAKIGYVSMDEIKAKAIKNAEEAAKSAPRAPSGPDPTRTDARTGTIVIDGVQARVVGVEVEREYRVGANVYRRRTPVFKVDIGFRLETFGRTVPYDYNPETLSAVAKLRDEVGRPQPGVEAGGYTKPFSGVLRADKEEVYTLYFEPPTKTRPLELDCWHPTLGKGKPFRFHIPASMYDVAR